MRTKFLSTTARFVTVYPWRVVGIAIFLSLISVIYTATSLQMNTDQDDLVSQNLSYHKRYKEYLKEFGDLEYLYVVVETGNNLPRAKEFVRFLAKRLDAISDVKEVLYQISNPKLEKSFLLYLPKDRLKAIGNQLPKMERINSLSDAFEIMNDEIKDLSKSQITSDESQQLETGFKFIDKLLDGIISATKDNLPYTPFLQEVFLNSGSHYDEDGFLLSDKRNFLFSPQ